MGAELPVINRVMDNTALSAFMTCEREHYLSMYLHRRADIGRSSALAYGSVIHILFDQHYKTGGNVEIAELTARLWWDKHGHNEVGDHRTIERAILDYRRYRERWGKTPADEQGKTVGWPDAPLVEIPFNIQAGTLTHPWAGKLDRFIELGGRYYIEDHKTTSHLDRNFYAGFDLDNQMMGYTWAGRHIAPELKIQGVRLNVIHILKDKTNFERQIITYTREQLAEWERNTNRWFERLRRAQEEWPSIEQLQEGAEWPLAHFGKDGCKRMYGLCSYHSLCSLAPTFRTNALLEIPVNEWDPMNIDE